MKKTPEKLTRINEDFLKDEAHIYYQGQNSGKPAGVLKGADVETFTVLDEEFSKDKKYVYLTLVDTASIPHKLKGFDGDTFELLDASFGRDKNGIYYLSRFEEDSADACRIAEADHASFIALGNKYAKDSAHAYYKKEVVKDADVVSFSLCGSSFAKDARGLYCQGKFIEGSDSKSFTVLLESPTLLVADSSTVYTQYGEKTPVDLTTFQLLFTQPADSKAKQLYAKDKNHVYSLGAHIKVVEGADPATFEVTDSGVKDAAGVMIQGTKVALDPNSFIQISESYAKDASGLYYLGNQAYRGEIYLEKMEGVDPDSFVLLGNYAKDNNHAYWEVGGVIEIKGADAATFEYVAPYAKDKNRVYFNDTLEHKGVILGGADASSFIALRDYFAKDAQRVYYRGVSNPVIDAETFEVINSKSGKDKNGIHELSEGGWKSK